MRNADFCSAVPSLWFRTAEHNGRDRQLSVRYRSARVGSAAGERTPSVDNLHVGRRGQSYIEIEINTVAQCARKRFRLCSPFVLLASAQIKLS